MDIKDIMILANNLRQERLLVNAEQQAIQSLNDHVVSNSMQVYQNSWIKCQQRINLNKLTIARSDYSPASCCQKANALSDTKFVEAQKVLRYQDVQSYAEFLQFLRCSPELVATCLIAGDQLAPEAIQQICCSLVTGLYGSCLLPEDTDYVLQILKCLMEMQLMLSEDPRRMLRNGSCAFSRLYLIFHEGLFSAKLFLLAILKEPVLQLLMEEEAYLDMDPDIALARNPEDEMLKKLGKNEHRKWTIDTLVNITTQFVNSLRQHWVLFPNSIAWLVRQMVSMLRKQNFPNKKITVMCTDLLFTHLICPAIVSPERYGFTDAPISTVQQFNLVQIAQIVQMLALAHGQEVEPKYQELYARFDKNCVSSLLESVIELPDEEISSTNGSTNDIPRLNRTSLMFTLQELNTFVSYFQLVVDQSSQENNEGSNCLDSAYKSQLTRLLANLPASCDSRKSVSPNSSHIVSPDSPKKGLLRKASKTLGRYNNALGMGDGQNQPLDENSPLNNASCPFLSDDNRNIIQDVLVIPLPGVQIEPLGLMAEHEVLSMEIPNTIDIPNQAINGVGIRQNPILPNMELTEANSQNTTNRTLTNGVSNEKRTRFSLSHEEGSIGNTSDNIEVVSEAASNHSVASSLELENEDQNDNLSDMTSANVSGRGTPNISGRDTPSSQVTEGGGGGAPEPRPVPGPTSNAAKSLKQSRSDIQDKFCKFEIKKLLEGDETVSIISDTWSTDVLASDSEAVESYERNYPAPLLGNHSLGRQTMPPVPVLLERNNRIMIAPPSVDRLLDASETASESAWSTDVLASDSEINIDTDDCHSVARSDTDTARSEVDMDHTAENVIGAENQPQAPNNVAGQPHRYPSPPSPMVNLSPIYAPQAVRREVAPEQISNDNSVLDGSVQLRTRNSSSSSIGSNRPSAVNGLLTNHVPSLNSTLNNFENDSAFHSMYNSKTESRNSQNSISNFTNRNSVTNNDVFHSISSPFVSAMASTARANGFLENFGQNYENERKFSDDIPDLVNNINSGVMFRPIQDNEMNYNVTGRGGSISDYRRRTMEYVDSNANNSSLIPHSPGSNEDILDLNPTDDFKAENINYSVDLAEAQDLTNMVAQISITETKNDKPLETSGIISKPGTSTGAIPKSISFDSTADKYHRDYDGGSVRRGMGNMFNKLKQGFRSRRGKGRTDDNRYDEFDLTRITRRQISGEDVVDRPQVNNQDTTEDILAKYRRKISSSSEAATSGTSDSTGSNTSSKNKNHCVLDRHEKRLRSSVSNIEPSCSYENAKHKLRLVLSTVDLQSMDFNRTCSLLESTLLSFLRIQLSESIALEDGTLSVQLHEAIRSIETLETASEIELCRELQFDYQTRSLYTQYLVNTRKMLLQTLAYLDRILTRISVERKVYDENLVRVCVRLFLENREVRLNTFCEDFRALGLSDEKMDLLESFLHELHTEMVHDQNWQAASEEQLLAATLAIERIVMGRVYLNALYPNGDGDIARDKVLHAHIERLSSVVTVSHKDLRIPSRHQREAPWPQSQKLLRQMSAYRAARDKARCVARCVTSVMHVLAMSTEGGCPAADDLVPVLVFILIKANPPALLSTVEYVNSFYGSCLEGAEHYWWIQFCSAIEFIKTMDEND